MASKPAATEQPPDAAKISDNEAEGAPVNALAAAEIDNYERAMKGHVYVAELPASDDE